ncbi:twin-arginine translocase subunit TatC [Rhodopirellula sp.]|nr:twin-arginine translocase subunit TatC [Rhodopirellula sp.]
MDRLAQPKDDLFENSTMTFREHLDELRHSLVRAVLWLAAGLVIGLLFADRVVLFVQSPLQTAIREYMADRDLFRLGYDPMDPANAPLKEFLATNALVWEIIYDVPDEYQTLTMDSLVLSSNVNDPASAAGPVEATVKSGVDSNLSEANSKEKSQPKVETDSASEDRNPEADSILEKLNFTQGSIKPVEMAKLLQSLPDPSVLKPKVQLRQNKTGLSSLKMEEPFMIWVKAGLIVGAVLASPMIFYHLWSFIASGLHAHERRYVYIYLPLSVLLFSSGVVLAFFVVLNYVLTFLLAFNGSLDVAIEPRLTYYVNFVLLLPLGFGIAFQLPLVMLFLQRIGLFETEAYVSSWRLAVLVIFLVSMILTPADVTSMFAMAVPLVFLYGLGILMCKFIPRGRGLGTAAYDPA